MSTANELIDQTQRHLRSGNIEELNRLDGAITDSATVLNAEFEMGGIQARAVIEIDMELMYVWSVSNQIVTVQRGFSGTTAAAHSDGALITVNPRFPRFSIFEEMNNELQGLSSPLLGLFRMRTVTLDYDPVTIGYDLTSVTDVLDIYEVRAETIGPEETWPRVNWELGRDLPTGDFASAKALFIVEGSPGQNIQVSYKAPFSQIAAANVAVDLTDTTNSAGLHSEAHDIVALGAAVRLMAPREVKRNYIDAEGDSRRAEEVPPGATLQSYRGIMAIREERINAERSRLNQRYPYKRRW